MACLVSDRFQEALGESMTALKLGGLVLKEEQKATLYAVTLKKQDCLCILPTGFGKSLILFYYYIYLLYFILFIIFTYIILFYYPTALRRVQITPKRSTNITRYLYSRGPVRQVFSQRASDELD